MTLKKLALLRQRKEKAESELIIAECQYVIEHAGDIPPNAHYNFGQREVVVPATA